MSFLSQLLGFIKRNLILKYRNKFQTFPEIYNPIVILIVLIIFNISFKPVNYDPIQYAAEDLSFSLIYNYYVFIYPNNGNTTIVGNELAKSIFIVKYFGSIDDMKSEYLNRTANGSTFNRIFGIEFSDMNQFPYQYKMYNQWDDSLFQNQKVLTSANGNLCRNKTDYTYQTCAGNTLVYNGFSYLQSKLNLAIKKVNNPSYSIPNFKIQNMPKGSYVVEQPIFTAITSYYFTLFFINSLITFVTNIVAEKEKKIKEVMRMMGMYDSAFW